ncbi:MAG: biotin--[acetyl-CoA-carboxylase] ligase [Ignavibacteriales bacterium]
MKHRVLQALKDGHGKFVSGGQLSGELDISRTAVWKHVAQLRKEGYSIVGQPRSGYALVAAPDKLLPEVIRAGLDTRIIGCRIRYVTTTSSTNDLARAMAIEGSPDGTVVVAEEQTGGKGRAGRRWQCPAGAGLLFSLVLRPDLLPPETPRLTLVTAVAVARGISASTGVETGIKWPNDLLIGGRKVCGILTEMAGEMDRVDFVVIGIGINVNLGLKPISRGAADFASLDVEVGKRLDRAAILRAVLREIETWYSTYQRDGFAPVLAEWRSRSVTLGNRVTVTGPRETFEGLAVDVDDDGALIVRVDSGEDRRVLSGDVSVRPA